MQVKTNNLFLSVDTEFNSVYFISIQICFIIQGKLIKKIIIFNDEIISKNEKSELTNLCDSQNIIPYFRIYNDDDCMIHSLVEEFIIENYSAEEIQNDRFVSNILFFYSFKDLEYCFGFNNLEPIFCLKRPNVGRAYKT